MDIPEVTGKGTASFDLARTVAGQLEVRMKLIGGSYYLAFSFRPQDGEPDFPVLSAVGKGRTVEAAVKSLGGQITDFTRTTIAQVFEQCFDLTREMRAMGGLEPAPLPPEK